MAYALNCPTTSDTELAHCLRDQDVDTLLRVKIHKPKYVPAYAPLIDHAVIPDKPLNLMRNVQLFGRYDRFPGLLTPNIPNNAGDNVGLRYHARTLLCAISRPRCVIIRISRASNLRERSGYIARSRFPRRYLPVTIVTGYTPDAFILRVSRKRPRAFLNRRHHSSFVRIYGFKKKYRE